MLKSLGKTACGSNKLRFQFSLSIVGNCVTTKLCQIPLRQIYHIQIGFISGTG